MKGSAAKYIKLWKKEHLNSGAWYLQGLVCPPFFPKASFVRAVAISSSLPYLLQLWYLFHNQVKGRKYVKLNGHMDITLAHVHISKFRYHSYHHLVSPFFLCRENLFFLNSYFMTELVSLPSSHLPTFTQIYYKKTTEIFLAQYTNLIV